MTRTYGGWPYNLVQLGQESTPGTVVTGSTIFRGIFGGWDDQRTTETIDEQIGQLFPAERTRITKEGITIPMPATPITYQQIGHILAAGIKDATPTGSGPYVYDYAFPTDASINDIKTYTFEIGNRQVLDDLKKIPYCWVEEFELNGEAGGLWNVSGTWQGQQDVTLADFSAGTLPTVTEAVFGNTLFYVDDTLGGVGTTPFTGLLLSARLTIRTGVVWVPVGDGNLYPISTKRTRPEVTFSFEYELEDGDAGTSFVAQERAKYKAEALRLFELEVPGPGNLGMAIRMAAKYDKPGPYADRDGNTSVTFEGHAVLSAADSLSFGVEVTNDDATLP